MITTLNANLLTSFTTRLLKLSMEILLNTTTTMCLERKIGMEGDFGKQVFRLP